jgi:hypothetical protein
MSIFNTTANTGFNSFDDPFNSVNLNQGGGQWGMNQNYLTPSFDAPYRPPYSGGQPSMQNPNPGWFRSAAYLANPFASGPQYGTGTTAFESSYWDQLGNRPQDFGAAFSQRMIAPLVSFGGAFAVARAWQVRNQSRGAFDWFRLFGAGKQEAMRVSGFTAMGQRFGGSLARGMIAGASSFAPSIAASGFGKAAIYGAAALGGAASGLILPAAIAQAGISGFESLVSDNYLGIRENAAALRGNFRGVSFGGHFGDPYTGQGLNRRQAARMGTELTQSAAGDQTFNAREVATMTNMASQMGMLDNASAEQIVPRMKSIMQQLKVVMSIAGSTDFKETMQMMAKLQMAGVSPGSVGSTMAGIGSFASQAGISAGRMFNTVGAQGQYLFQANGLTPYLGQLAAGSSMAGQAAAFRSGLVSPEMMARLGGVEGATQLSVTGQVNASQTTYNMMRLYNKYTSGQGGGGVMENVSNFGRSFAGNPMSAYGALLRTGKSNISEDFKRNGMMGTYQQMMDLADMNPQTAGRKMGQNEIFALLSTMGMSPEQSQSFINEMRAASDPKTVRQSQAGAKSFEMNMMRDFLEQTEQTRFKSFAPVAATMQAFRGAKSGIAGFLGNFQAGTGGLVDSLSNMYNEGMTGSAESLLSRRMNDQSTSSLSMPITSRLNNRMAGYKDDIDKLKSLAEGGDERALAALGGDKRKAATAIYSLGQSGHIDSKYGSIGGSDMLADVIANLPKEGGKSYGDFANLETALNNNNLFSGSTMDKAEGFRLSYLLQKKIGENGALLTTPDEDTKRIMSRLTQITGEDDPRRLKDLSGEALRYASNSGISMTNGYEDRKSGESLEEYLKRTNGVVREGAPTFKNDRNVTSEQVLNFTKQKEEIRRQESIKSTFRDRLMSEGRIDLLSSYDMVDAAKKLDSAADKLDKAADKILGDNSKGNNSKAPLANVGNNWFSNGYNLVKGG